MEQEQCRLCGKSFDLPDLLEIDYNLQKMVEYHCRLELCMLDLRYPNKMCFDCNYNVENFSKFSEDVKQTQLKFSAMFQDIKIEIDELPALIESTKSPEIYFEEPKVELEEHVPKEIMPKKRGRKKKVVNAEEPPKPSVPKYEEKKEIPKFEEIEDEDASSSESGSDYESNKYYKRKKPTKHRRVRAKKKRGLGTAEDEDYEILQDVPEGDRYKNGTMKKKSLCLYEDKTWSHQKIACVECDVVTDGPYLLRQHHFKYHSLDSQFKCPECTAENLPNFNYLYQFLNHYFTEHFKHLKFCCVICSEMFWNTKSLYQHYESSHDKPDRIAFAQCKICGLYFRKIFDLINHESRMHNLATTTAEIDITKLSSLTMEEIFEDEFKIPVIDQKCPFSLQDDQKNADGTVTTECKESYSQQMWNNIGTYQCTHCGIQSSTVYQLYEHYNSDHNEKKNNFVCKSCPDHKIFLNLESFVNHTFTIHHEHLRYFCFICNDGYWNFKTLYHHYKKEHEDYKAFICLHCGKYHNSVYGIRHHKEVHSGIRVEKEKSSSRSFTCSMCPKSFTRQNQLQRHLDTHVKNEGKVWICETCGKSFNAKSTLINHAMVHQTDKPFVCTVCGEGFKNKYKLKHHKEIHTGVRNFGCEICGQRFRAKGTLKGHILTHTGERPFSCEFCDKRFAAKYDLMVHTRLHTGEFTHECPICHERYPSWSNYSKHMRGRHQIDPRSEKKKKYDAIAKSYQESKTETQQDTVESMQFYPM